VKKLVIIGVGLIGGSLALALRSKEPTLRVVGVDRDQDNLHTALQLGIIDQAESSLQSALKAADVVVIATPVAQTQAILAAIAPFITPNMVITDVGSTKTNIVTCAGQLGRHQSNFVPGHPIAGAEKSGAAAANASLFAGKHVILTPTAETSQAATSQIRTLWKMAGANITQMSPEQHDRIFAAVSHLPHALAFALVEELAGRPDADKFFSFAASGFRDFTRIAGSSPEMWRDISLANKEALLHELSLYQQKLTELQQLIESADADALKAFFQRASTARLTWETNTHKTTETDKQ
jgi:prephenate dehydrogenase